MLVGQPRAGRLERGPVMTIYVTDRSMTSDRTPESAWSVGGGWRLSWLPEVELSRRDAMLGMTIDELLSDPELVDDVEIFRIVTEHAERLGCTGEQAALALARRMLDRLADVSPRLVEQLVLAEDAAERARVRAAAHRAGVDREEFAAFYRDFMPRLVAFVIRHGAQPADAADIAQETMIEAYRSWPRITSPSAWCFHVAHRKFLRARTSRYEHPRELLVEQRSALTPPEVEFLGNDTAQRVLARLPGRQRQIMAWIMFGFTPKEIAEELKISPEAVRGSLKKARRALAIMAGDERDRDDRADNR